MADPVFRNAGAWGSGLGRRLTSLEVDGNFWALLQRIVTLEDSPEVPAGIDHFEVVGSTFYVHLNDDTILGPYTLPTTTFRARGEWTPSTYYVALDTIRANGGLYLVLFSHTSEATFDAGANDGSGNDYYSLMLQAPDGVIPTGGAAGMVLTKSTSVDLEMTWDWKLPDGMVTGRFLMANTSTRDDASWVTLTAEHVNYTPGTSSGLTSGNVQDALDELGAAVDSLGSEVNAADVTYEPSLESGLLDETVADALNTLGARNTLGRQTIWVPSGSMTPLITNGPAQGLVETTTSKNVYKTLDFDQTTVEIAQFELVMPKSWDGDALAVRFYWSHASGASSFDVVWKIEVMSVIADTYTLDGTAEDFATVTDTGGTTNVMYVTAEVGGLIPFDSEPGTLQLFRVSRTANSGSDTLNVDARLQGVEIFYNTDAYTDD